MRAKPSKLIWVLTLVAELTCLPAFASAEESNREEVRSNLRNGWSVVYGKTFTEADWVEGTGSIAESIAADNPGPFLKWFGQEMDQNLVLIRANLKEVAMSDLQSWILQSLKQKTIIQYKGLQIEAGFATYNRWQREVHDEPRPKMKYQKFPWGGGTDVPDGIEMHRVENTIPLPNWHQFYVRYKLVRVNDGASNPAPSASPAQANYPATGTSIVRNKSSVSSTSIC